MITMKALDAAYQSARKDLADVGLRVDGRYLDRIACMRCAWPSGWWNECGFVYDRSMGTIDKLLGFEEGVIYVPFNAPTTAYKPGASLTDVVRHEFAHAWYWLDPRFVNGPWFREAFGASYDVDAWEDEEETWDRSEYVSDYAMTCPREDFAETFMTYLRFHRSLERFRPRRGVYRKLKAVEKAVKRAARERVNSARPRRCRTHGACCAACLLDQRLRERAIAQHDGAAPRSWGAASVVQPSHRPLPDGGAFMSSIVRSLRACPLST